MTNKEQKEHKEHKERNDVTMEGSLDPVFVVNRLQSRGFQAVHEPGLGHGYALSVGHDDTEARVGIFPQTNAVEVVSGSSILRLEKIVRVRSRNDQLLFEALQDEERVTLEITPDGRYSLTRQPRKAEGDSVEGAEERHQGEGAQVARATPARPVRQHERARAADAEGKAPGELPAQTEHTVNERVTIRGRVGNEARFRHSGRRNVLIGSFALGEHPDLETTIWHTVVVFGDRAAKLKEKGLTRGQEIEVVGYVHEREVTTGGGGKSAGGGEEKPGRKTLRQIYATAIRTTLRTSTGSSDAPGT